MRLPPDKRKKENTVALSKKQTRNASERQSLTAPSTLYKRLTQQEANPLNPFLFFIFHWPAVEQKAVTKKKDIAKQPYTS